MGDESLEVETVETETQEIVQDKVEESESAEADPEETKEPSNTDEEVKEKTEEKKEPTEAEKVRHAMQRRLDRKTAIEKQQAEELEQLRKQVEGLKPQQVDNTPKESDFETFEDWQSAVVEHKANELLKEKELSAKQEQLQRKQQEAQAQKAKRFEEQELKFVAENPDYKKNASEFGEVVQDLKRIKGDTPTMIALGQVLTEIDDAPALINHLGKNSDLAYELADMSPVNAAFKLFEIRQELTSSPEPEQAKPAPVKALKGSGKPSKTLDSLSSQELVARFKR